MDGILSDPDYDPTIITAGYERNSTDPRAQRHNVYLSNIEGKYAYIYPLEIDVYPSADASAPTESIKISADDQITKMVVRIFGPSLVGDDTNYVPVADGTEVKLFAQSSSPNASLPESAEAKDGYAFANLLWKSSALHAARRDNGGQPIPGASCVVLAHLSKLKVAGRNCAVAENTYIPGPLTQFIYAKSGVLEIVPGKAANLGTPQFRSGSREADGVSTNEWSFTFRDQYGNLVVDGTPVQWNLTGPGVVGAEESGSETIDGKATITIRNGVINST